MTFFPRKIGRAHYLAEMVVVTKPNIHRNHILGPDHYCWCRQYFEVLTTGPIVATNQQNAFIMNLS